MKLIILHNIQFKGWLIIELIFKESSPLEVKSYIFSLPDFLSHKISLNFCQFLTKHKLAYDTSFFEFDTTSWYFCSPRGFEASIFFASSLNWVYWSWHIPIVRRIDLYSSRIASWYFCNLDDKERQNSKAFDLQLIYNKTFENNTIFH